MKKKNMEVTQDYLDYKTEQEKKKQVRKFQCKQDKNVDDSDKSKFKLTAYERETIFNFNEEEAMASIYTYSSVWIRRLDKLCAKSDLIKVIEQDDNFGSKTYELPKKCIRVRLPIELSEEAKQKKSAAAKERFNKMWADRKSGDNVK